MQQSQQSVIESKVILVQSKITKEDELSESTKHMSESQFQDEKMNEITNLRFSTRSNKTELVYDNDCSEEVEDEGSKRKLYSAMKQIEINDNEAYEKRRENPSQIEGWSINDQESENRNFEDDCEQVQGLKDNKMKFNKVNDLIGMNVPEGKMLKCVIKVHESGILGLQQVFELYLLQDKKMILRAVKKRFSISSKYLIYAVGKDNQIVAKIQSNYSRTEYKLMQIRQECRLYNISRFQPQFSSSIIKINPVQTIASDQQTQKCYLSFQSNIFAIKQLQTTLIKPKPNKMTPTTNRFSSLKTAYQNCEYERIQKLSSRLADKNKQGRLFLDFKDKNIMSSSKNTILQNQFGEISFTFAKKAPTLFAVNIMHPLTLLQGLFMGVCNLDSKLFV